jgi:hypothetical protein
LRDSHLEACEVFRWGWDQPSLYLHWLADNQAKMQAERSDKIDRLELPNRPSQSDFAT